MDKATRGSSRAVQRERINHKRKLDFPMRQRPTFSRRDTLASPLLGAIEAAGTLCEENHHRDFPGRDSTRLFPERKYLYPGSQRVEDRHAFAIRRGVSQAVEPHAQGSSPPSHPEPGSRGGPRRDQRGEFCGRAAGGLKGAEIDLCDETGAEPDHPPRRGYYRRGDCDTIDVPDLHILMSTGVAISNKGTVHLPAYAP